MTTKQQQTNRSIPPPPDLEKPECDEHFTVQLRRARDKINEDDLASDIDTRNSQLYAVLTMRRYGDYARKWKWTPNHTETNEGRPPRGFQFSVSPRSPIFPAPFPATTMFNGLMAFPLSGPTYQNLTMTHFADLKRLRKELLQKIDEELDLGVGDDNNFVGFYFSSERGKQMQFWCVTQCHSTALSREVFKMICDAEPENIETANDFARRVIAIENEIMLSRHMALYSPKPLVTISTSSSSNSSSSSLATSSSSSSAPEKQKSQKTPFVTWEELFFKTQRMRDIQQLQRKHRANVILKAIEAVGLASPVTSNSLEKRQEGVAEAAGTVDTTFNCVDQIDTSDETSDIVYLDQLTSVYMLRNRGVVFREQPNLGVTIMKTPWNIDAVRAQAIDEDNTLPFIGIPIGTGTRKTNSLMAAENEASLSATSDVHFWQQTTPNAPTKNYNFNSNNNRDRHSAQWIEWLKECGFLGHELTLTPILVRYAVPDVISNETLF